MDELLRAQVRLDEILDQQLEDRVLQVLRVQLRIRHYPGHEYVPHEIMRLVRDYLGMDFSMISIQLWLVGE